MVKVLGFDVGIKNLAYCIVEKIDDKYLIQSNDLSCNKCWNIINLTEQDKLSFPNLNLYDYTEQVNKKTYYCDNFNIIVENKKIFIDFDKYDEYTLNKIVELF